MSNLFFGLNIGRSALLTNQAALSVTGHNLANVQTEGYSRQRVEMTPSLPIQLQSHTFGSGVNVDAVDRVSAAWVERQLNRMQGQNGYDSTLKAGLDQVQAMLGEPSSDGIGAALTEFFNSWDALSLQPGDSGLRAQVLHQAENLAGMFNQRIGALGEAQETFNQAVESSVAQANTMLQELADLNAIVANAAAVGKPANDMADRRDLLVNQLAETLGVEVETDGPHLNLRLPGGGPYVVNQNQAYEITWAADADGYASDFRLGGGPPAPLTGGEVGALLELRDDISAGVRDDLTQWMVTVVDRVNDLHVSGFDRDGNSGRNLFTWSGAWDSVSLAASTGVQQVDPSVTLQAGTHHLAVRAVTGLQGNTNGSLAAGTGITLTAVNSATFPADYTGALALNQDYHVRVEAGGATAGDLAGTQVRLYRGDQAVSEVVTLGSGASLADVALGSVDGVEFQADFSAGAGSLATGNRSDGLATVGTVLLDGGAPPVAVDLTGGTDTYTFVGGSASGFLAGGTASARFSGEVFSGASFSLYGAGSTLAVDVLVAADADRIAASADPAAPLSGDMARQMADLSNQRIHENTHETPAFQLGRIVQELGAKGQEAAVFESSSGSILLQLQAQREGISGVNVDEEMVLLIQYQRGFEAAARFLTTVDGLLDHLINNVGR
ncbi:MAG: flagellar hook-associated protein FlgK [Deferrisomatales bacterium]|nr:flagellar hook-associated protein FlgK [Deferrisomatales bacterium]